MLRSFIVGCLCLFAALIATSTAQAVCGSSSSSMEDQSAIPAGWTLCYVNRTTDVEATPCNAFLTDLENPTSGENYADQAALLAAGGNFGCLNQLNFPGIFQNQACTDDFQQTLVMTNCANCIFMAICVRYP